MSAIPGNGEKRIGTKCPSCGAFMAMRVADLLTGAPVRCQTEGCGTVMRVNQRASRQGLRAIESFRRDLQQFE